MDFKFYSKFADLNSVACFWGLKELRLVLYYFHYAVALTRDILEHLLTCFRLFQNRSEGSEDDREGLEQKIKCRHAVHLFCQHKYKDAMDIFLGLDTGKFLCN